MDRKKFLHPPDFARARQIQEELLSQLKLQPLENKPSFIAAADATFSGEKVLAAVLLFAFPELKLLETQVVCQPISFPYRPGYLSFREGPAILTGLSKLSHQPDLVLLDGQGIAHPKKMGLATFVGIISGLPSVGCAKSHLVGRYQEPEREKGCLSPIELKGEIVGYCFRSRTGVKPIFISPGHLINLEDSLRIIQDCLRTYRLPEPLRQAHQVTTRLRQSPWLS
ncbi:MAG TPA: endonuclease V [Candidatus Saccharicenans sp.]|jgi:deoxyribonuclease V|nr:endonuclease V [Candidatus Saccharicenans sp.]HRD02734.1 endonuclease V [Candidatus Saccharicenans sp.]